MKEATSELIKAESRRDTFGFITEVVQRGKARPKKYKHDLAIPAYLYEDLRTRSLIDFQQYFIDESAFFEFDGSDVIISFQCLYQCEDMHRRVLTYLVVKFAGSCPIKRGGRFF